MMGCPTRSADDPALESSAPVRTGSSRRQRWLIRHGESAANAGAASDNPGDIPLTETGHRQARELAHRLPRPLDLIVLSPVLRTRQTAQPTVTRFPARHPGRGSPVQECTYLSPCRCVGTTAAQRHPLVEAYRARLDPAFVNGDGAESFTTMAERARALRRRLDEVSAGFVVVLFTHGQIMQCCRLLATEPAQDDRTLMAAFLAADRTAPIRNGEILEMPAA